MKIFFRDGARAAELLRHVGYGLEEEGIPFEATAAEEPKAAAELAWEASHASQMEVGIGIDSEHVALHYAKLPKGRPLFKISVRSGEEPLRTIGTNAGRLVKKLPLKIAEGSN